MGAAEESDLDIEGRLRELRVVIDRVVQIGDAGTKKTVAAMLNEVSRQVDLLLAGRAAADGPSGGYWPDWVQETWNRVEDYFDDALLDEDDDLDRVQRVSAAAGLPAISVSPSQGKFLSLLAESIGARRILEVGTLGGYSTIWLARALPAGGRVVSLEVDRHHAEVARGNLANAGLADNVEIHVGPAITSLAALHAAGEAPFDLVFVDADKQSNADYFAWALRLTHPGSLIVVDNVVRHGLVGDADSTDPGVQGVHRLVAAMAVEACIKATAVQTVGSKGYDGMVIGLVVDPD